MPVAAKQFDRLTDAIADQIERDLMALAGAEPQALANVKRLSGIDAFRVRSGDRRIIFVERRGQIVELGVKHRRKAYRSM